MTAEERRKLLQERYGLDDKKSKVQNSEEDIVSDATSGENVDEDTKKKSSAGKKVLIGTLAAAAVLGAGAGKAKYDQYQNKADDNAIVYDDDNEKTGTDREIADMQEQLSNVQENLFEASEKLSGEDKKLFATEARDGKFKDLIFDVDHDGTEEDIADQFINQINSYQARLTSISAIEDETEKAVQFALLKEEMNNIKMILNTNDSEDVKVNKFDVIADGYNDKEPNGATVSVEHIRKLYGENPVFAYQGSVEDINRIATSINNGTEVDMDVVAFETNTKLEDGKFKNDETLLNGQEITLDLVNRRQQVEVKTQTVTKTVTQTVYVPVATPAPAPAPQQTVPTPGPSTPDIPTPTPDIPEPPTPNKPKKETQKVVNPTVPVVQTEDQEQKIPETVSETTEQTVVPSEETVGPNVPVSEPVYEGHEPTQSYNFDAVANDFSAAIESAAAAEVAAEETYYESSEAAPQAEANGPEEETVME
ncbi:MAG: hypothetical protein MJ246_01535 [Clostridia bacterium]|nr:hypothetical protein [Clostridia bacterium]